MLVGHLQSQAEEGQGSASSGSLPNGDVPPQQLADPDSRWVECGGVRVHYKLAMPLVRAGGPGGGAVQGRRGKAELAQETAVDWWESGG